MISRRIGKKFRKWVDKFDNIGYRLSVKKPKKLKINEKLATISPYDLSLTKEEAFRIFNVKPQFEYDSVYVDFNIHDGWGGSDYEFELRGQRDETDEEYSQRAEKIKQQNAAFKQQKLLKEKKEKELYEKLKKKFEK